jgi:hypothetical protein
MQDTPLNSAVTSNEDVQPTMISTFTPAQFQALLQQQGYRVEVITDDAGGQQLRSATGGLTFYVRFGNRADAENTFVDATIYAGLRVQGDLPFETINLWNVNRRFCRLQRSGEVLVLEMDVSAVGGVSQRHILALAEIWDRLAQDLIRHLKESMQPPAPAS